MTKSDDNIRDFQIEGINIGDSLLKYFPRDKIEASKQNYFPLYPGKKFGVITLYVPSPLIRITFWFPLKKPFDVKIYL